MKYRSLTIVSLFATLGVAGAKDLSVELRASAQSARLGDEIVFTIRYVNTSSGKIGILPEYKVYAASELNCVGVDGSRANRIPFGQANFDIDAIIRSFTVLKPGESHIRKVSAKISSRLPKFVGDQTPGVYLVFRGSAIKLPTFGIYRITTDYKAIEDNRTLLKQADRSVYWVGRVESPAITVDFQPQ